MFPLKTLAHITILKSYQSKRETLIIAKNKIFSTLKRITGEILTEKVHALMKINGWQSIPTINFCGNILTLENVNLMFYFLLRHL